MSLVANLFRRASLDEIRNKAENQANPYGDCETLNKQEFGILLADIKKYATNDFLKIAATPQHITWMLLDRIEVCPIERVIDRMSSIRSLHEKKTPFVQLLKKFDECIQVLAKYVVIYRNPYKTEPVFYMLGVDEFGQKTWVPKNHTDLKKLFAPSVVKIKHGSENMTLDVFKTLQVSDWRIIANYVTVDYSRPLIYLDRYSPEDIHDCVFFNVLTPRSLNNQQIIHLVTQHFKDSPQVIKEYEKLILQHLKHIAASNDESYEYLLNFVTMCFVENYHFRPLSCPWITNVPGGGKSTYFKSIFEKPFGNAQTLQEKPTLTQLGILESIVGRQIVMFDEPDFSKGAYLKFKSMITNTRVNLRAMYKSNVETSNVSKFIIFANESTYAAIEGLQANERRFPLFQADNVQLSQADYFDILYKYTDSFPYVYFIMFLIT